MPLHERMSKKPIRAVLPAPPAIVLVVAALAALAATPATAQVDLSGTWRSIRHEDLPDRGPGVGLGDYTGIPLTDAARQWAESWSAARLSVPEEQCRVHVAHYIYRGPMNLRIWEEKDPRTQEVIAIKHYISTYEQTHDLDGRPASPARIRAAYLDGLLDRPLER